MYCHIKAAPHHEKSWPLLITSYRLRTHPNDGTTCFSVGERLPVLLHGFQMPRPYPRIVNHGEARDAVLIPMVHEILSRN